MTLSVLIAAAILLPGVTGENLRARAFFDANNVKVGDPMILTVDFLGEADFHSLHPPALSRAVDRADWKLDDASAKTDTFRDARRLTYRIRPMREGLLWFPALEFQYRTTDGTSRIVRSNEIPVHARPGLQVAVDELQEEVDSSLPQPPALVDRVSVPLTDDQSFAWRKALSHPTARAFAAFDFPEARLNEATCLLREGNWAQALKLYSKLEWRIGQTPEIERGIIAALALRDDNPAVELPIWRQVLRPVLKWNWCGRVGLVLGGLVVVLLLYWLIGRGIRAVACLAIAVGCVLGADAQDIFQQMEAQMNRMRQQMQQTVGGLNFSFGGQEEQKPISVSAAVTTDKSVLQVGAPFSFILALEYPKTASVGQIRLTPSERFGLTFTGPAQNLPDGKSANPSNVVKRIGVPARYDVPFKGRISFAVDGMVSERSSRRGGFFSMSFSTSFRSETRPLTVNVKPLSSAGQPADFAGIISEGLRVHETCDLLRVGTNDVVTITYRMFPRGFVPVDFLPKGAAFEWNRRVDEDNRPAEIEYRRFFVADGAAKTPKVSISYYDPRTKTYKTAETGGTSLVYTCEEPTR